MKHNILAAISQWCYLGRVLLHIMVSRPFLDKCGLADSARCGLTTDTWFEAVVRKNASFMRLDLGGYCPDERMLPKMCLIGSFEVKNEYLESCEQVRATQSILLFRFCYKLYQPENLSAPLYDIMQRRVDYIVTVCAYFLTFPLNAIESKTYKTLN